MADDSYVFSVTKYIEEQKRLLALERERFAAEKIRLLEPANVDLLTVDRNSDNVDTAKQSKDEQNSMIVQSNAVTKNNFDPSQSTVTVGSKDHKECPVETLLKSNGDDGGQFMFSASPVASDGHRRLVPTDKQRTSSSKAPSPMPEQQKQQDEMEQWVSDTFYSYFPSFNKNENEKKSMLSRNRQADYQEYLKNVNHIANVIPQVMSKHQQYIEKYGHQAVQTTNDKETNTSNSKPVGASGSKNYLSPPPSFSPNQIPSIRKTLANDGHPAGSNSHMRKDTIDRRNRMLAEEESRRKLEYQKDLIKQIEEKRKEVERLREKEKLEEEMLTSRLEQQLKTMQLEEELEREKLRSEKIRMANEQNHIRRLQLLSKLENDHKVFNPHDENRKTLSENGKEAYVDAAQQKPAKEKVYRYFSNSAQNEKPSSFTSSSLSSEMDYDSSSESMGYDRYQYCKNCRADIDRSFLPRAHGGRHHQHHHHHQQQQPPQKKLTPKMTRKIDEHCLNCHKRIEKLCVKCDRVLKRSLSQNICAICQQAVENKRIQKEAQLELRRQRQKLLRSIELLNDDDDDEESPLMDVENPLPPTSVSPPNPYKIIDIQYHESDNDHDLAVLNPVIVRNNYKKPYSLNIDKDSIFHPNKKTPEPKVSVNIRNGEVFVDNKLNPSARGEAKQTPAPSPQHDPEDLSTDEMDDRISKYVKHYNTLWMKRGMRKNNLISQKNANPSSNAASKLRPLPSLSPPKVYVSDRADNLKSDAMKITEKKWDIPAVERTKVSPGSPRVLTQLGAIRKQLQLEQLHLDSTTD
ncbi:basic-leucine zipper transcription factor A isoform X6 [Malaya genurostris]|uniref:basic-leucine zipper transcription factor A isoform X6 n=1 Tax=Malaya genurostris TaxID=325434 RepID=UPI0026F3872F|nr:basic-leucine zipper transcription factor A isoform X6 [Malaya genurostris]